MRQITNKPALSVDRSNMRKVILDFPLQFEKALIFCRQVKIEKKPVNKIVICGMGGSALPGDLVKVCLSDLTLPIKICRDYQISTPIDEKTLVLAISFSGNTEETLSCFKNALIKKAQIVAIACGGQLEKMSKEARVPFIKFKKESLNFQPRSASGYIFTSIIYVFEKIGLVSEKICKIQIMANNLKKINLEDQGKELAKKLKGKIPLIYSSSRFWPLALIWKIKFNENSKVQAFFNVFPELNHNEMVGFTKLLGKYHILILRDKNDHSRILKRMALTADLLRNKGLGVTMLEIQGKDLLTKIFSTLRLGDWISYYLALEYGLDPTPVQLVEDFKRQMAK